MQLLRIFLGILCFCVGISASTQAQAYSMSNLEAILRNSRWQFTYSSHYESEDVLFRAEDGYNHFIWFKYTDTAYTFFNGEMSAAVWALNKDQLEYNFSKRKQWRLVHLTQHSMQLEFTIGDSTAYRYHFVRVEEKDTPFFKYGAYELGEAKITRRIMGIDPHPYRYLKDQKGKRFRKGGKSSKQPILLPPEAEKEFLQVEMGGGGFFGKPDYIYRNHIIIKNNGSVVRELQNETQGLRVWKAQIPRQHLEDLVKFIEQQDFFELEQLYSCQTNECMNRLRTQPRPIALRIAVTKGNKRKVVVIPVFEGVGVGRHLVHYPPAIDAIYKVIDDVAMIAVSQ